MTIYNQYNPTLGGDDYPIQIELFINSVGTDVQNLQNANAATKIIGGTENNLISQDANGNIQDAGLVAAEVPSVVSFSENNLVAFDASGDLIDAGRPKVDVVSTYTSPVPITISQGGVTGLLPHNLGSVPITSIFIRCTSIEGTYAVDDEVLIMDSSAVSVLVDDTNYNIRFSDLTADNAFTIPDNFDGSPLAITNASWVLIIRGKV